MDFVNQGTKQVVDLFESMSPGARITAGLLLAAIVVALAFLVQTGTAAPDELLLGGTEFSRSDLDAMEAAFAQEGLNNYERLGNKIRIPRGQREIYVAALAKNKALPTNFHDIFARSLDEVSPWQDSKTRDSRLKFAKQRELSLIVSAMAGIERATVQFDEQVSMGFPRTVHKTAVVAVQPVGSAPLTDETAANIVDFMVHAVAGLRPDDVTVTDLKSNRSIVGGSSLLPGGAGKDPYSARKLAYERDWTDKVRRLLAHVPGAAVSVNVELDPVVEQREQSTKIDPKPVALETRGEKRTETSQGTSPGGRPGVATNTANQPASVATTGVTRNEQREQSVESQRNVVSTDQIVTDKAGLTPVRVSVAVTIPTSYYLQMYQQKNPVPAGQEAKRPTPAEFEALEKEVETRLSSTITPLLPKRPAGVDPYPQVVVTRMPDLPVAALAAPTLADNGLAWLGAHWSTLGMIALGLFGVTTLRGWLSSLPTPEPPAPAAARADERPQLRVVGGDAEPAAAEAEHAEGAEQEAKKKRRRRAFAQGGPNLREELVEIVKEDPDAAAKILRNWIGEAS